MSSKTILLTYSWAPLVAILIVMAIAIMVLSRAGVVGKVLAVAAAIVSVWVAVDLLTRSTRLTSMGLIVLAPADPFVHSGNVAWFDIKSADVRMHYGETGPGYRLEIAPEDGNPFEIDLTGMSSEDSQTVASVVAAHLPKAMAPRAKVLPAEVADAKAALWLPAMMKMARVDDVLDEEDSPKGAKK